MAKKKAAKKAAKKKPAPKKRPATSASGRPRNVVGKKKGSMGGVPPATKKATDCIIEILKGPDASKAKKGTRKKTPAKKTKPEDERPRGEDTAQEAAEVTEQESAAENQATDATAAPADQAPAETPPAETAPTEPAIPTEAEKEKALRHYQLILDAQRKINVVWGDYQGKKLVAKAAKENYDGLVVAMHELVNNGPDKQGRLRFEDDVDEDPDPTASGGDADSSESPSLKDPEWMAREISVLIDCHPKMTMAIVGKLAENDVKTLGDLHRLWERGRSVNSLKGFGDETAGIVNDAYGQYGMDHPEIYGMDPAPAKDPASTDPDPPANDEAASQFPTAEIEEPESSLTDKDFSLDDLDDLDDDESDDADDDFDETVEYDDEEK
jgi:hypothetical protein